MTLDDDGNPLRAHVMMVLFVVVVVVVLLRQCDRKYSAHLNEMHKRTVPVCVCIYVMCACDCRGWGDELTTTTTTTTTSSTSSLDVVLTVCMRTCAPVVWSALDDSKFIVNLRCYVFVRYLAVLYAIVCVV